MIKFENYNDLINIITFKEKSPIVLSNAAQPP